MKTIIVDGVKYVEESKIEMLEGDTSNPFLVIGMDYFIRTVTHYFTGRLVWVGDKEIALEDVCWIADTGRFNEFVAGGGGNETEPYKKGAIVLIGRGSIVDMTKRIGGLITVVK